MADPKPLALDVDGTFLRTDMLYECFWAGLGKDPRSTLSVCARHFAAPAILKAKLVDIANLRTDLLPVNEEIAEVAHQSQSAGVEVILASASDSRLVAALAADHGFSTRSFGSDGVVNLKGAAKAGALVESFGEQGFHYAGDDKSDQAIWEHADGAIAVGPVPVNARDGQEVARYSGGWQWNDLLKALRPHQWVKNILLVLPMIAAHDFSLETLGLVLLGIVAFSFAASSIYIVNDLLDLEADRLHPTKKNRPFAAGLVPIGVGMLAFIVLSIIALGVGAVLGPSFLLVIAVYMVLSLAYSLQLKRMRWIDIATLASLYTLRVVAGAAASQVEASMFMLIFIFPIFVTLGCVKRLTELTLATDDERLPGRGYGRPDRGDLLNVAALGMVFALLIFFLYSFTEQAVALYPSRWILWVALIPIAAWLFRMVRLGYKGKQDYDPIVFALRDRRGLGLLLITLSLMFYAAGLWQEWFGF